MAKANTRYVRDIQLNMPDEVISYVITDWLNRNSYSSDSYKGEPNVFSTGGVVTAKDYVKIIYQNGAFHIESWIKSGKREIGVDQDGMYGWAIKSSVKTKIDQFIDYLLQQQYVEHPQAQQAAAQDYGQSQNQAGAMPGQAQNIPQGQPYMQGQVPQGNVVNITGYHDDKAAKAPLVIGIILCAISLINLILLISTGVFLTFGAIFIVLAIFGITSAAKAIKLTDGSSKAKAALALNIIGCIAIAVFFIVGLVVTALS